MNNQYLPAISKIFTPVVMDDIAYQGYSGYLSEVCKNSGLLERTDLNMPLSQFFDWVYNFLFKNYRNEYIYKNTIANKILLGKHSLNTSHMLTEFRAGKCKADAVVINGTSTVYEIKSEYDSFSRLENQINSYFQVFDHINIITSRAQAMKLRTHLPDMVGILVLSDRNTISTVRNSKPNKKNIKPDILFDSLRKTEYLSIIKKISNKTPNVPNTQIHQECKKIFCSLSPEFAHDITMAILKDRKNALVLKEFINKAPSALAAYALSIGVNKSKMLALIPRFNDSLNSVLNPKIA